MSRIVYGSTKGFVSYGGFTHVGFPLRTSVSPPTLYPSSIQLPLSPISPSPVTTFPSSSLSCSPLCDGRFGGRGGGIGGGAYLSQGCGYAEGCPAQKLRHTNGVLCRALPHKFSPPKPYLVLVKLME
jgi:hypothetical protein